MLATQPLSVNRIAFLPDTKPLGRLGIKLESSSRVAGYKASCRHLVVLDFYRIQSLRDGSILVSAEHKAFGRSDDLQDKGLPSTFLHSHICWINEPPAYHAAFLKLYRIQSLWLALKRVLPNTKPPEGSSAASWGTARIRSLRAGSIISLRCSEPHGYKASGWHVVARLLQDTKPPVGMLRSHVCWIADSPAEPF